MPIVSISRKESTLAGFCLEDPSCMLEVLEYIAPGGGISGTGYTGTLIQQNSGTSDTVSWQLLINDIVNNTSVFAQVGDAIVLENNTILSVVKQANIDSLLDISAE